MLLSHDLISCWSTFNKIMWLLSLTLYNRLIGLNLRSTNCLFSSWRKSLLLNLLLFFLCFILNSLRPRLSRKLMSHSLPLVELRLGIVLTFLDKRVAALLNFLLPISLMPRNSFIWARLKILLKLPKPYPMLFLLPSLHKP